MRTDDETPAGYLKALLRRTKSLREDRHFTQAQMASFLGLKTEAYKKYETRSALPHRFINEFCALVGTDEVFFLTGKPAATKRAAKRSA